MVVSVSDHLIVDSANTNLAFAGTDAQARKQLERAGELVNAKKLELGHFVFSHDGLCTL
jgi:hypothetical protein